MDFCWGVSFFLFDIDGRSSFQKSQFADRVFDWEHHHLQRRVSPRVSLSNLGETVFLKFCQSLSEMGVSAAAMRFCEDLFRSIFRRWLRRCSFDAYPQSLRLHVQGRVNSLVKSPNWR